MQVPVNMVKEWKVTFFMAGKEKFNINNFWLQNTLQRVKICRHVTSWSLTYLLKKEEKKDEDFITLDGSHHPVFTFPYSHNAGEKEKLSMHP